MIHDEICTYEVAKLAKEKGFRETVGWYYNTNGLNLLKRGCNGGNPNLINGLYSAPTQSLLQRWLREEKKLHIDIVATASGYCWVIDETNGTSITDSDVLNRFTNDDSGRFDTYELSLEDALKYALENLVLL